MSGMSFMATIALLFAVTSSQLLPPRTAGMKLIRKGKAILIKVEDELMDSVKCYMRQDLFSQNVKSVDITHIGGIYLLMDVEDGHYWCEDGDGLRSNSVVISHSTHNKKDVRNLLVFQKPSAGESSRMEADPNLTEPTPIDDWFVDEDPLCPRQTTIDVTGHRYDWPPIKLGEFYFHRQRTRNCIEAVRQCVYNQRQELELVEPSNMNFTRCSEMQQINVTQAASELQKLARKANVSANDLLYATSIANQALQTNRSVLHAAREDASSMVRSLESILTRVQLPPGESVNYTQPEISVFVMNTEQQKPQGVALSDVSQDLAGSSILTMDKQINQGSQMDNIDIAVIFPDLPNEGNKHLSLAFFNDDGAFRDENRTTNSRIVSVNMDMLHVVEVLFKPFTNSSEKSCVFWDFNRSGGIWSDYGCELVPSPSKIHDMCRCTHLTHFAEIISPPGSFEKDLILDIISLVGCSLSLAGLLGIFVTGAAFWQWREQLSNKILLHLSAAVALNMVIFLVVATGFLPSMCVPLGALLHYSILTSFCWMLVCAGLQFMRLVSVLGTYYTSHLLLKASIFAWGAPLIPVSSLLVLDVDLYEPNGSGLCYPGGLAFYLAVLCPVVVIVVINLIVFGTILHRLFESSTIQRHVQSERKLALRRFMTSLLLFFLLGLTWVFGLLAALSKVFAYLFCITATLQGAILFLFFVLGEKKSRRYWTAKNSIQKQVTTSMSASERDALRHQDTVT